MAEPKQDIGLLSLKTNNSDSTKPQEDSTAVGLLKAVTSNINKLNPNINKPEIKSATIGIRG